MTDLVSSAAKVDNAVWHPVFRVLNTIDPTIRQQDFFALLEYVAPPPVIVSFGIIACNFLDVLKHTEVLIDKSSELKKELGRVLPRWRRCCETFLDNRSIIESLLPKIFYTGKNSSTPPFRKYYETYPLGVALWCSPADVSLLDRYRPLQACLSVAFYLLRSREKKNRNLFSDIKYRSCRCVRKLAHPEYHDVLLALPRFIPSLSQYLSIFKSVVADEEFRPIILILEDALGYRQGRGRTGRQRKRGKLSQEGKLKPLDHLTFGEGDAAESAEKVTVNTSTVGDRADIAARKKQGLHPEEFNSWRERYECEESKGPEKRDLTLRQQHFRASAAAAAISMRNQLLPHDWDRLTCNEIRQFLSELEVLANGAKSYGGIPGRELAAFLCIIFWTSVPLETAAGVKCVPSAARSDGDLAIELESSGEGWWVIKPRTAKLKRSPKKGLNSLTLPLATRFTIDMPVHAASILYRFVSLRKYSRSQPFLLFLKDKSLAETVQDLEAASNKFLGNLRHRGGRQFFSRIATCLHGHLCMMPGSDPTAAMSITTRNDPLGTVPLHYTANEISRLRRLYGQACMELMGKNAVGPAETEKVVGTNHVGSRFVPKESTVESLVTELRKRIGTARHGAAGNPIMLHNDLTVYTVMMIGFATGYRAVRDPLLQSAEIDLSTGFAVISDKDDSDFYNSRIVWLPHLCIKQLEHYREHVRFLRYWLFQHNQNLFFASRLQETTGRHGEREFPSLFLIDRDAQKLTVRPLLLEQLLRKADYPLPLNANRHFLRSNLLAAGCPIEVIDAYMGHWERGMEPWGRFSGLSPLVYREVLAEYLVPLLEKCGWKEEPGLTGVGASKL